VYRLAGEEELREFLSYPQRYASVQLPQKWTPLPAAAVQRKSAQQLLKLGKVLGFMEQTFAQLLIGGMSEMEGRRMKYPGVGVSSSAVLYLSLWLKSRNPQSREWVREKFAGKLKEFEKECQTIQQLAKHYKQTAGDGEKLEQKQKEKADEQAEVRGEAEVEKKAAEELSKLYAELRQQCAGASSEQLQQHWNKFVR